MIVPDGRLDPPVAIDYVTVIEPGDFIWTLPSSKGPRGTADFLNGRSWQVVRLAGQRAEDYELALRMAYEAIRCEPTSAHIMNTVGVAEYRVGAYEEALVTLLRSDRMNRGIPEDSAFLALCYHHLGDPENAERHRQRFLQQIQSPRHRGDAEVAMFREEVKAVFGE
jgi:tetratricopeptide (TPR) repeat protein